MSKELSIKELTLLLEEKINEQLGEMEELGHGCKLAMILKEDHSKILKDMKKVASKLECVLFIVEAQWPKYAELIKALLKGG